MLCDGKRLEWKGWSVNECGGGEEGGGGEGGGGGGVGVFFFQAEDGIRDRLVTGVQTCALPIYILLSTISNWVAFRQASVILGLVASTSPLISI